MATTTLDPQALTVGDRFVYRHADEPVTVEVTGDQEPCTDLFGRDMVRYMCRRDDTGASGYMVFGPGAVPLEAEPAPELNFTVSGRVELRKALTAIRRQRPARAHILWIYSKTKSSDDLPVIEVPEGTILMVTTFSGIPHLVMRSGRVILRACSSWGNAMDVRGGELHVVTDGGDRKVTIHVNPEHGAAPVVTTSAEEVGPDTRMFLFNGTPDRLPLVVAENDERVPVEWLIGHYLGPIARELTESPDIRTGTRMYVYGTEAGKVGTMAGVVGPDLSSDRERFVISYSDGSYDTLYPLVAHPLREVEQAVHVVNSDGRICAGGPGITEERALEIAQRRAPYPAFGPGPYTVVRGLPPGFTIRK